MGIRSRKGQLTAFIVVGLVIALGVFFTIYITTSSTTVVEEETLRRTPSSFEDYIESCINLVGREAVENLGYQGGFIYLPDFIKYDSSAFISLDPRNEFGMPSWYHKGEYIIPSLEEMEFEIERFVENNLDFCLNDYSGFTENFVITEKDAKVASARVADEDVLVLLNYPVDVSTGDDEQIQAYEKFQVTLPVKLGKMHELAKRIVYSEVENNYFEKAIIDLMSADPRIPLTGIEFSCTPKRWYASDVSDALKTSLYYDMPKVRFTGTDYPAFDADSKIYESVRGATLLDLREGKLEEKMPDDSYDYFNFFYDIDELPGNYVGEDMSFIDLKAGVKFNQDYLFDMNVRPSSSGLMQTHFANFPGTAISFMCLQNYHFVYDLDLLLEVDVFDQDAFDDDGYMFRFALPVNIRNNEPNKISPAKVRYDVPTFFENPCDELDGRYDIRATGMFSGFENFDLEDVEVSYDCIKAGCDLGTISADNGVYRLVSGLPKSCANGFINARKEGYLDARMQHTGNNQNIVIEMQKIKEFNIEIEKFKRYDLETPAPFKDDDYVVLRISPHDYEGDLIVEYTHDSENINMSLLEDRGEYFIDALLIDPEKNRITGGYRGNFTYEYVDTAGKDTLVIGIMDYTPLPAPFDAVAQAEVFTYIESGDYLDVIEPRFE